jgi:hypothetical protein
MNAKLIGFFGRTQSIEGTALPIESMHDIVGNSPVDQQLNVRRELALFKQVPLFRLINRIESDRMKTKNIRIGSGLIFASTPVGRFLNAYRLCYLVLERILPEMSALIRGDYFYPYAKGIRFTQSRQHLAARYHAAERFFELDLLSCLMLFRILADRTIALSRYFLTGASLPSFSSFSQHKTFFKLSKYGPTYGIHEEYAEQIRMNTAWFDVLKIVRDDFLVHNAPKHFSAIGYTQSDLDLVITFVPLGFAEPSMKFLQAYKGIALQFSLRRLLLDLRHFFKWFDSYGCRFPIMVSSN